MPDGAYLATEGLLRLVELLGRRRPNVEPPVLPDGRFPWLHTLTTLTDEIRLEATVLVERLQSVDSTSINELPVGVDGQWRLVPLVDRRGAYPYTDELPVTMSALRGIPRLRAADFAILAPGSRIRPHVGNNWGC